MERVARESEVTERMSRAGVLGILGYDLDEDSAQETVVEIYRLMEEARESVPGERFYRTASVIPKSLLL